MTDVLPMPIAVFPANETQRAEKVKRLGIAGLDQNDDLSVFGEVAKSIVGCDFVFINVSDDKNQYTTCAVGGEVDASQGTPREETICQWSMCSNEPSIYPDINEDDRFKGTAPTTIGVIYYAGFPLITPEGFHLGVMCLVGGTRIDMTDEQINLMKNLAKAVTTHLLNYGDLNEINAGRFSKAMTKFRVQVENATLDDLSDFLTFCNSESLAADKLQNLSDKGLFDLVDGEYVLSTRGKDVKKDMNMSNEKLKVLKSPVSAESNDLDEMLNNLEDM